MYNTNIVQENLKDQVEKQFDEKILSSRYFDKIYSYLKNEETNSNELKLIQEVVEEIYEEVDYSDDFLDYIFKNANIHSVFTEYLGSMKEAVNSWNQLQERANKLGIEGVDEDLKYMRQASLNFGKRLFKIIRGMVQEMQNSLKDIHKITDHVNAKVNNATNE